MLWQTKISNEFLPMGNLGKKSQGIWNENSPANFSITAHRSKGAAPVLEKILFPSLTQKSKSSSEACTPWQSCPSQELLSTGRSFSLMCICHHCNFTALSHAVSWDIPKLLLNLRGEKNLFPLIFYTVTTSFQSMYYSVEPCD